MQLRPCFRLALAAALVGLAAWLRVPSALAQSPPGPADARPADSPELDTAYDQAFAALVTGRFAEAAAGFELAAERSADPERRAAARELGRLARAYLERQARLVVATPETAEPAPGAVEKLVREEDTTAGRTGFVVSTTLASLYSGVVLIDILDLGDALRPSVAVVTGTTALGFVSSLFGSRDRRITEAMSDSYTLGLLLGGANGLLLASPFGSDTSEGILGLGLAGMALGGGAGMLIGHQANPTRGQVALTQLASIMGLATAGLGLVIVQPEDFDEDVLLLTLAGGMDLGAGLSVALAPQVDWSLSRARLSSLGALLGGLGGWALSTLAVGTDGTSYEKVAAGSVLAGMWGGFALSAYLTRNMAPDRRFLSRPGALTMIQPAVIRDGIGVSVAGAF